MRETPAADAPLQDPPGEGVSSHHRIVLRLKWEGVGREIAHSKFGLYSLGKSRIRHGRTYETEWHVMLYGQRRLVGIGGTKKDARDIAQRDYEEKAQNTL